MKTTPPDLRRQWRQAFTLVELLVCGLLIAFLVAIAMPVLTAIGKSRARMKCAANMRQVGMTILNYGIDQGGIVIPGATLQPPAYQSGTTWMALLDESGWLPKESYTGLKNGVMTCPVRPEPGTNNYNKMHYALNRNMGFDNVIKKGESPYRFARIARPSQTMILGETEAGYLIQTQEARFLEFDDREKRKIAFPHDDTNNIFFADGHMEVSHGPWQRPKEGASYPFY